MEEDEGEGTISSPARRTQGLCKNSACSTLSSWTESSGVCLDPLLVHSFGVCFAVAEQPTTSWLQASLVSLLSEMCFCHLFFSHFNPVIFGEGCLATNFILKVIILTILISSSIKYVLKILYAFPVLILQWLQDSPQMKGWHLCMAYNYEMWTWAARMSQWLRTLVALPWKPCFPVQLHLWRPNFHMQTQK